MKSIFILAAAIAFTSGAQAQAAASYFIVQNIATEKMRIYERCTTSPDCAHRMIFETDMVVGKLSADHDLWTRVGTYKVEKWVKFYEDGGQAYPSWYDSAYPATPAAGGSYGNWSSSSALPNGQGALRGAFGWYAAMLAPSAHGQWIHGTIGWGADGDKFIQQTRSMLANIFSDPRSHGCTRLENRAVAYVQSFITAGTDVFRVYAKEAVADSQLQSYQSQRNPVRFDFILTKDQVRKDNPNSSAKPAVESRLRDGKISSSDVLEEGSYEASQFPSVQGLTGKRASSGKSGDTYSLGEPAFHGVFMVDQGRFVNYEHPEAMPRGGVPGASAVLPDYTKSNLTDLSASQVMPQAAAQSTYNNNDNGNNFNGSAGGN